MIFSQYTYVFHSYLQQFVNWTVRWITQHSFTVFTNKLLDYYLHWGKRNNWPERNKGHWPRFAILYSETFIMQLYLSYEVYSIGGYYNTRLVLRWGHRSESSFTTFQKHWQGGQQAYWPIRGSIFRFFLSRCFGQKLDEEYHWVYGLSIFKHSADISWSNLLVMWSKCRAFFNINASLSCLNNFVWFESISLEMVIPNILLLRCRLLKSLLVDTLTANI